MRSIISKFKRQTRWQVYARVLPVVFLAVMLVGAFGWHLFNRYGLDSMVRYESKEVAFLLENLHQRALTETMGLEARKGEAGLADTQGFAPAEACPDWAADLLSLDCLMGVAQVVSDNGGSPGVESGSLASLCLVDSLSGPVNRLRLQSWCADNRAYFVGDLQTDPAPTVVELGFPARAHLAPWHPTFVFPPILLEAVAGQTQASAGGELSALLPVLVRKESDRPGSASHTVYFLSLNRMLRELLDHEGLSSNPQAWWCLVNRQGRVIDAADGLPTVGSLLRNQHRTQDDGPFAIASGEELVGGWQLGLDWENTRFGRPLAQWVVTAGQADDFPVAMLIGRRTDGLRAASLGYVFAVFGVALLALSLSFYGISRVIGRISGRVGQLASNLELVAQGDYSRHLPAEGEDEVGHLITYFNRMAASLDETQGQLVEKTQHLEAALENRQLLDRAKDDFLVLISHEVRTPLTSIMGGVELLKGMVRRTTGPQREALDQLNLTEVVEIIESSGARLHGFMNDAIQMTSIQSSDKELHLQAESVGSLVELGLCGLREIAATRGIEVVNGLEQEQSWLVLCDARVLKLAFQKILKNAVVHNYDKGRVVIREVQEVPGQGSVADLPRAGDIHRLHSQSTFGPFADLPVTWRLVEIFNTGDAIPVERCAALFAKFELVGRIEHHQRGSGLSLPIAQSAVEYHGGRVFINSVKLQGNSFYLLLPTISASDFQRRQEEVAARGRSLQAGLAGLAGEELDHGFSGRPGNKSVDQTADVTALEVELQH